MKNKGTRVYKVPLSEDISLVESMSPLIVESPYQINYIHSYGQDSPFFAGLTNGKLFGTKCSKCAYTYGTPKAYCMYCGVRCNWIELPLEGRVHTFTVCYYGSEEFLEETPFVLVLVEWDDVDTLFLSRLLGVDPMKPTLGWIGMKVRTKFKPLWEMEFKPTDVYFVPA